MAILPEDTSDSGTKSATDKELPCVRCSNALPLHTTYKHYCDACRQAIAERNAQRMQELEKVRARFRAIAAPRPIALPIADGVAHSDAGHDCAESSSRARKRKAEEVGETAANHAARPRFADSAVQDGTEYQTEDALFDSLAAHCQQWRADASSYAEPSQDFTGRFTVVLDPAVSSVALVERIVSACHADRRIPIGKRRKLTPRYGGAALYTQHHWCTCKGVEPPPKPPTPPAATPDTAPLKRSQSTLIRWLAAGGSTTQPGGRGNAPGRGVCGGRFEVEADTDYSHPLARKGVKGHRVTVRVLHLVAEASAGDRTGRAAV